MFKISQIGFIQKKWKSTRIPVIKLNIDKNDMIYDNFWQGVWNLGVLNHVAIAVPDIDKAALFYKNVMQASISDKQVILFIFIHLPRSSYSYPFKSSYSSLS